MAIIVNLIGAPGAGKSTGAAYVFAMLKMNGVNAEYVGEFAKDKVWEGAQVALKHQEYIFGKQSFKQARCADCVDVVVTDSPLLLSIFYNRFESLGDAFNQTVLNTFNSYDNLVYFIERVKEYNPSGRMQTKEESDKISEDLKQLLTKYNISYNVIRGQIDGYNSILTDIYKKLNIVPSV